MQQIGSAYIKLSADSKSFKIVMEVGSKHLIIEPNMMVDHRGRIACKIMEVTDDKRMNESVSAFLREMKELEPIVIIKNEEDVIYGRTDLLIRRCLGYIAVFHKKAISETTQLRMKRMNNKAKVYTRILNQMMLKKLS